MTGQLRTTMQRHAETLEAPSLDLDAIMAAGRSRSRRRTAIVGGVAAAAMVAGGAVFLGVAGNGNDSTAAEFADVGGTSFSYAVGSVIHSGDTTTDMGVAVSAYVQTSTGVVFADPEHRVFVVDKAAPRQIGTVTDGTALVADDAGSTVAWVDGNDLKVFRLGQPDLRSVPVQQPDSGEHAAIRAISDGFVWFWDARGTMAYDVRAQQVRHVLGLDGYQAVQDVAQHRLLAQTDGSSGSGGMAVVDLNVDGASAPKQAQVPNVYSGDLSPDGRRWFTEDADQFSVYDSVTGRRRDPPHPGFAFAAPYRWLDDDTIAVLALATVRNPGQVPVSLLTCHVSTNDCTVTARDIGTSSQIAIPVGRSIAD